MEYEEHIQNLLRAKLERNNRFTLEVEVGHFYNGYENPSNVYDYEQSIEKNEWTVFIRAKNPQFRPLISKFISFTDFMAPKAGRTITVNAPEEHFNNV